MIAAMAAAAVLMGGQASAASLPCQTPAWRLMYRHDADGRPIAGSKEALFTALRRGDPVRVAWGGAFRGRDGAPLSVEHSADPVFVSIAGGREVIAQIPEHVAQAGYQDEAVATYENGGVLWRGLFSTTGRFDAIWVDRGTGKEVRRFPQRAAVAWLAFAPEPRCDSRPVLDLATPGGVRRADPPKP
jgi:hypothetical protein